jgi:tRNA(Ile)-lysidine synthase
LHFRRNALRQRIMPVLTDIAPELLGSLGRLARHARTDTHLLDELARIDLASTKAEGGLDVAQINRLDQQRAANLLRYWLKTLGLSPPVEATLIAWLRQLRSGRAGITLHVLDQRFSIRDGVLVASLAAAPSTPAPPSLELQWLGENLVDVPAWAGVLYFEPSQERGLSIERLRQGHLTLRRRSGGERMQLVSHAPSRTLKNLYQEAGIATTQRSALPLLYCDDKLVFAAGLGMNLRQCEDTSEGVRLRWVTRSG